MCCIVAFLVADRSKGGGNLDCGKEKGKEVEGHAHWNGSLGLAAGRARLSMEEKFVHER